MKALSTGINDPTTAMLAIDRLTQILAAIADGGESRLRGGSEGRARLLARATTFDRVVGLAFDQLRVNGAGNPAIAKKVLDAILQLLPLVNEADADSLRREARLLLASARESCPPEDLPAVEELAAQVLPNT